MIQEKIKELRKLLSLTQKEFAEKAGTSQGYLSDVENGRLKPGFDFLISVSRFSKVNLNWLMVNEGSPFYDIVSAPVGAVHEEATKYDTGEVSALKEENKTLRTENNKLQAKIEVLSDVISNAIKNTEKQVRLEPTPSKQRLATIPTQ